MGKKSDKKHLQPITALKALRELVEDPEKTDRVFTIIRAMSGDSLQQSYARFRVTPAGKKILEEKRSLLSVLQDRETLRAMPPGSLAAHYLKFVEAGELTADGLVAASDVPEDAIEDESFRLFAERMRDQHDLWHTLTDYGMDPFGEACLLAFTYAQTKNRGLGIITLVGMLKLSQSLGRGVIGAVHQGYRAGKAAAWLPQQDWEHLLAKPIEEVRQHMNINRPEQYHTIFDAHLAGA